MAKITGTKGNDVITPIGNNPVSIVPLPSDDDDSILGLGGNDYIEAGGGNDTVEAGDGNDTVFGNAGNDKILGGNGNDLLFGDSASELAPSGDDTIDGGAGNDTINGGGGNDSLLGGSGDDLIYGRDGNDTLDGGTGNDFLFGDAGDDVLIGGDGNDVLFGGAGKDTMTGGKGDDYFYFANDFDGDTITDFAADELLIFQNALFSQSNVVVTKDGFDAVLSIDTDGDGTADGELTLNDTFKDTINDTFIVVPIPDLGDDEAVLKSTIIFVGKQGSGDADTFAGTSGRDRYDGGGGDDTIAGGAGNDLLSGGDGNDLMKGDAGNDRMFGGGGDDTMDGGAGNDEMFGGAGDDLLLGGDGADTISGDAGNDTINGGGGNDLLDGGGGDDVIDGGAGNDAINGGAGNDTLRGGDGNDRLQGADFKLEKNATSGDTADSIDGGAGNDTIIAGYGADTLRGGAGNDIFDFQTTAGFEDVGKDSLIVDFTTGDVIRVWTSKANKPAVPATALLGTAYAAGQTVLSIDLDKNGTEDVAITLAGKFEHNLFKVGFTETATADGFVGLTFQLTKAPAAFGETYTGTGGNDTLIVFNGNNTVDGGDGDDTIIGGSGNDSLIGGAGEDWLSFAPFTSAVTANLKTGRATGKDVGTDTVSGFENIQGGLGNDNLTGDDGNNILDGGAGNDTMTGGKGNDTYIVDSFGDRVVESKDGGTDRVLITAFTAGKAFTLADHVEDLEILGSFALAVTGNALANKIDGNSGANTITGAGGDDTITGGGGKDTFVMTASMGNDVIKDFVDGEDLLDFKALSLNIAQVLGALTDDGSGARFDFGKNGSVRLHAVDGMALVGGTTIAELSMSFLNLKALTVAGATTIASDFDEEIAGTTKADLLIGGDGDDTLNGGAGNDTLVGGFGNDLLDGGTGNDSMYGGDGDDTYVVDSASDKVFEVANGGNDLIESSVTYTLPDFVENLTLTGLGKINGTGNALANEIIGNDANNLLDGKAGNDILRGGGGNDTLRGGDGDDALYGDAGNDSLDGGAGSDTLDGGEGNDTMAGGAGNDTYIVDSVGDRVIEVANGGTDLVESSVTFTLPAHVENLRLTGSDDIDGTGNELANLIEGNDGNNVLDGKAGNDLIFGGGGDDQLLGGAGNDTLSGDDGDDELFGGDGNDILTGGAGADTMTGGAGADRFVYQDEFESGLDEFSRDVITDFTSGQDKLDLSAFGLASLVVVEDAFSGSGEDAEALLVNGVLSIDLDGDGDSNFDIAMVGLAAISVNDFII